MISEGKPSANDLAEYAEYGDYAPIVAAAKKMQFKRYDSLAALYKLLIESGKLRTLGSSINSIISSLNWFCFLGNYFTLSPIGVLLQKFHGEAGKILNLEMQPHPLRDTHAAYTALYYFNAVNLIKLDQLPPKIIQQTKTIENREFQEKIYIKIKGCMKEIVGLQARFGIVLFNDVTLNQIQSLGMSSPSNPNRFTYLSDGLEEVSKSSLSESNSQQQSIGNTMEEDSDSIVRTASMLSSEQKIKSCTSEMRKKVPRSFTIRGNICDLNECNLSLMSKEQYDQLFDVINTHQELTRLEFKENGFNSDETQSFELFCQMLHRIPPQITVLDFRDNGFEFYNQDKLNKLFFQVPATVKEIYLTGPTAQSSAVWLKRVDWPVSYSRITREGATNNNIMKVAETLLDDYTKGNSCSLRFFSGHWNRHYVGQVGAIVLKIQQKNVPEWQKTPLDTEILTLIKNIKIENQCGSLARRISFIEHKNCEVIKLLNSNPITVDFLAMEGDGQDVNYNNYAELRSVNGDSFRISEL